jgi:hypothetical protein
VDELSAYRFMACEDAVAALIEKMARRLPLALRAYRDGCTVYLHDGEKA